MRSYKNFIIGLSLLIIIFAGVFLTPSGITQSPEGPQLHLHRGRFDIKTANQTAPTLELGVSTPGSYAIIQLKGPITLADRQALEKTGLKLLEYLPDYAYLVQGTASQLEVATALPQVYARTSFTLADKFAPSLLSAIARNDKKLGQVKVIAWPGNKDELIADLQIIGFNKKTNTDINLLLQLASLESVRWIEPVGQPKIVNDRARVIMEVHPIWQNHQLFGTDQIIAIADTGLDTGNFDTLSPDFTGRIVATHVLAEGGTWADEHGHGTHVAGSVAGAGVQSGADPSQHLYESSFAGIAPEANLIIQGFEVDAEGSVYGIPEDYYELFAQAYTDGARIHSNSWGDITGPITDTGAMYGGYNYGSQRTDAFMWDHPDMTIFFAAGNSGADGEIGPLGLCANGNGIVDPDSLLAPGTAKNVITVGASESNRTTGGMGGVPWLLLSFCFATEPIATDTIADNPEGMAAFSSRGPVDDGRIKPDIVSPGTNILSNRSHHPDATVLWGEHEVNLNYVYSGGTSMATPLTAGMGVLVRQWLVNQGVINPSAAVLKSILLNTTVDIAPGQYGVLEFQEIPYDRPNAIAGWGRSNINFIDAPLPYGLWLDDHTTGLTTGEIVTYTHTFHRPLTVLTNTQPLRVMLTWTDPPASLSADTQLVNDLDLVVIGPGGTTYYGNAITTGDRINNVEGVVIHNPPLGQYQVAVQGFNIPIDNQPYGLTVAGPINAGQDLSIDVTKSANVNTAEIGELITYTYQITNTGYLTLTGLTAIDDKLGQVSLNATTLAPNQSSTGILTYTTQFSDLPGPIVNTVIVSGTTASGPVITVTGIAMESVDLNINLAMTISKQANANTVEVGETITYTYQVLNTGNITLTAINGQDDKLGMVLFNPNTIGPAQSTSALLTYTTHSGDLPGPVVNTVTISGTAAVGPPNVITEFTFETVNLTTTPALNVSKQANANIVEVGETITYTYQVWNTGNITLTAISGQDDKLGDVIFNPDIIGPAQSTIATLTYTAQSSDLPGPIVNNVTVGGVTAVGPVIVVTDNAVETVYLNGSPALSVSKQANTNTIEVGETITYTYQVWNTGNIPLTNIMGQDDKLGQVIFNPNTLEPAQSAIAILSYTTHSGNLPGPIINTVIVSGVTAIGPVNTVTSIATETVNLSSTAALSISKQSNADTIEVGETVTYTYQVWNTGNITLTAITGQDDKLGQVIFNPNTIGPAQTTTALLTYVVQLSDLPGHLTNIITVSGTTALGAINTVTATATKTITLSSTPAISVAKLANVNVAEVGQTVSYTYWITNSGNITLTDIVGYDDKLGQLPLSTTSLNPNQSIETLLTYTIQTEDLPGPLVNTITVSGTSAIEEGVVATATEKEIINLSTEPLITVAKWANANTIEVGDTITYTYQITNSGNVALAGLEGNDDKLGAIVFNKSTLQPTQSAIGTLTYTIQLNDLPGPLVNIVTVSGSTTIEPMVVVTATDIESVNLSSTPAIMVVKQVNVNIAQVGQILTYTYQVTNTGNIPLNNVMGIDDKLGAVAFNQNNLAVGQSTTGILTYTVQTEDLPGPLLNTVIVSGTTTINPITTIIAQATQTVTLQTTSAVSVYLPLVIK